MKLRFLITWLILLAVCTTSQVSFQRWQVADLQLITQARDVQNNNAIIAAYSRIYSDEIQFRVDLLDIQTDDHFDVYLLLDDGFGSQSSTLPTEITRFLGSSVCQKWDWLFILPDHKSPKTLISDQPKLVKHVIPHIQRDPVQDTITISLNRNHIKINPRMNFQVFIAKPGEKVLLDQTPCVSNHPSQLVPTAPILIEFSNNFNAVTPAQALRQWDGAHTGPAGERHGLEHILTNAYFYRIPIVLLDLIEPTSLSALDFIGGMTWVRKLERSGLLLLPDFAYSRVTDKSLALSRSVALNYHFRGSQFVFAPFELDVPGYPYQFQQLSDTHHILRKGSKLFIPLPDSNISFKNDQISGDGLSLKVRQALLATALSPDPSDFVVLGGDMDRSLWGDATASTLGFAYISNHPWMQPLHEAALKSLGNVQKVAGMDSSFQPVVSSLVFNSLSKLLPSDSITIINSLQNDLNLAQPNMVTDSAWSLFLSLTEATTDPLLADLRAQYFFLVKDLLLASRWFAHPWNSADCNQDVDGDLLTECLVTSQDFFSLFDLEGGTLTLFFIKDGDQVHQVIGPTSQLAVGLSDPSRWKVEAGPFADPALVPGAFSDPSDPAKSFKVKGVDQGSLELESLDGKESRYIVFNASEISIIVNSDKPINQVIPLVVDPQSRFQPGWADLYHGRKTNNEFYWSLGKSLNITISSSGSFKAGDFTESKPFILKPENPNIDYPPGHFLPIPLARIDIYGSGSVTTKIQIDH